MWAGAKSPYHEVMIWPVLRASAFVGLLVTAGAVAAPAQARAAAQAGGQAPAQPPAPGAARSEAVKKAKEHFSSGQRLFTVSRYREALEQFKEAYVNIQDPVFLFNVAQCHRLLGERAEAVRFYRRYLEAAPKAPERARAEKWISELEGAGAVPVPPAPAPSLSTAPAPVAPTPVTPPPASPSAPIAAPDPTKVAVIEPAPIGTSTASEPSRPTSPVLVPPPIAPGPVASEPPGLNLTASPPDAPAATPIYKRWWFWTGVAVVVVGTATVIGVAATRGPATCGPGVDQCVRL